MFGEIHNVRKPTPIIDPVISQESFKDILLVWNNYTKYAAIIKDIIDKYEKDEDAESNLKCQNDYPS